MGWDFATISGCKVGNNEHGNESLLEQLERAERNLRNSFQFHRLILYAGDGDLIRCENAYTQQDWRDVLRAIRYNMRKELIQRYSPSMPYMKPAAQKKLNRQIDKLSPEGENGIEVEIYKAEMKRKERLIREGKLKG